MKYVTDKMEIMANYLNHRGFDIQKTEYDGIPAWEINDLPVDDPMDLYPEYSRDLAKFIDGWEDGEDITKREGFEKFFVKGEISENAPEGCERYDGLFRDTILFVSVRPTGVPTIWLTNNRGQIAEDATDFRVRRINRSIDQRTGELTLYLRITGGVWENIYDPEEIE